MRYAVLTTKHHEGFCRWPSALTDYQAVNTPAGRDLVRPWVEAFRAEGLKIGFHHSLLDWHHVRSLQPGVVINDRLRRRLPALPEGPLEAVALGAMPWGEVITHRISYEEMPAFYSDIYSGKAGQRHRLGGQLAGRRMSTCASSWAASANMAWSAPILDSMLRPARSMPRPAPPTAPRPPRGCHVP